jgi:hypothetical protein
VNAHQSLEIRSGDTLHGAVTEHVGGKGRSSCIFAR